MIKYVLNPENNLPMVLPEVYFSNGYTYTDLYEASDSFLASIGLTVIPPRPSGVNFELIEWDQTSNNWVVNEDPSYIDELNKLRCDACVALLSGVVLQNLEFFNSVPGSDSLYQSVVEVNAEIQATISGLKSGVYDCDTYPQPKTVSYQGVYIPV